MQLIRTPGGSILQLLPGLISMSVLFGTTSMLAVTITFERSGRSLTGCCLRPSALAQWCWPRLWGSSVRRIQLLCPRDFRRLFVNLSAVNWALVLPGFPDCRNVHTDGATDCGVGKTGVRSADLFKLLPLPMLFLCGLFVPPRVPIFLRPLSYCLPLTYGTDILNGAIIGAGTLSPLLCFGVLIAFALRCFALPPQHKPKVDYVNSKAGGAISNRVSLLPVAAMSPENWRQKYNIL